MPRKIIFLVDKKGGRGKTTFLGWLGSQPHSIYLNMEKKTDMLWMTPTTATTICVNVGRQAVQFMNYGALELLKDGMWTCSKYQGKSCFLGLDPMRSIHLIVAMNEEPNMEALSDDRYFVMHLDMPIYNYYDDV